MRSNIRRLKKGDKVYLNSYEYCKEIAETDKTVVWPGWNKDMHIFCNQVHKVREAKNLDSKWVYLEGNSYTWCEQFFSPVYDLEESLLEIKSIKL